MIRIDRIGNIKHQDFDKCYAIVRSMSKPINGFEQLSVLSPSWSLFKSYRNLAEFGQWNKSTFDQFYVPPFLWQMHSTNARCALNQLFFESKAKNIALVCFCVDETLCHRSIVGGLLEGAGAEVCYGQGEPRSYAHYFDMYRSMQP